MVDYISVTSDNEFVEFKLIPGSIEVDSVCVFDFRNITFLSDFNPVYRVFNNNLSIIIEQSNQDGSNIYEVELYTLTGKQVYNESIESLSDNIIKNLSLDLINSGVYILRVSNQYQSKSQKILITK